MSQASCACRQAEPGARAARGRRRPSSSASLAPTQFEVCSTHQCSTITASAELEGTGQTSSFRSRFTERDGTCTFTFTESGERQSAVGTIPSTGQR